MEDLYIGELFGAIFAIILITIIIIKLENSHNTMVNSKEYAKGYDDYPYKQLYKKLKNIETETSEIYNYCKGFEQAMRDNKEKEVDKTITEFNKLMGN